MKCADELDMVLEVFSFEAIWLVDDFCLLEIFNHGRCPNDHNGIFTSCKFRTEERTYGRTSIIVWIDSVTQSIISLMVVAKERTNHRRKGSLPTIEIPLLRTRRH